MKNKCKDCRGELATTKEKEAGIHKECATGLWLERIHKELGHEVAQEMLNEDGYVDNQLLGS